jgi:predicted aldo/keto reductase-like oxidoreductase
MQYRTLPKTGDQLSALGFGCMRLPQKDGKPGDGKIDRDRAIRQIDSAIDQGVNYLDTAMPYHQGDSEPFLGEFLNNGRRDKVRLATKLPPWRVEKAADMEGILTAQMDRLATERIDYYLLHGMDNNHWPKMLDLGALEFLDQAKSQGRILNAGFSFHGDLATFKAIVDAYDWQVCQIQYNYLDELTQAGTEGLEYAAAKDLGVIIMEPLRGGNLAGRMPAPVQAIWDEAEVRRSPAEWALRWIWNRPEVTVILSGMNEEAHVQENIRIAADARPVSLTADELALVRRVEATYRRLTKVGCTGCRYCMPCPQGVNIPDCFEFYNSYHMFGDEAAGEVYYFGRLFDGFDSFKAEASRCEQCGQCEEVCPQHLPIPELLAEVANMF